MSASLKRYTASISFIAGLSSGRFFWSVGIYFLDFFSTFGTGAVAQDMGKVASRGTGRAYRGSASHGFGDW